MNQHYYTDLSDSEWQIIEELQKDNRKRKYSLRSIWNALFYIGRSGCPWRLLPRDFPSWEIVWYYYRTWRNRGLYQRVMDRLRERVRQKAGRKAEPTVGIVDSQCVKGSSQPMSAKPGEGRGFDGFKKVKGRKRHLVVDTLGLVLVVFVHSAQMADTVGAIELFRRLNTRFHRLIKVFADQGYQSSLPKWVACSCNWMLEIVQKQPGKGFNVLPKRWVVERTFAWLDTHRRLARDYEQTPISHEAFVKIAMIRLCLKRL